jgi:hypothetical protein
MGLDPWPTVVRDGYRLSFWEKPRLSSVPTVRSGTHSHEKNRLIQEQFTMLLQEGAIEEDESANLQGSTLASSWSPSQTTNDDQSLTSVR